MSNIGRTIKIVHHTESNWYRAGETYVVKDDRRYEGIECRLSNPKTDMFPM